MQERIVAETIFDKMGLVVDGVSQAKSEIVKQNGIGEDLTISLYGWKHNELLTIGQMLEEVAWGDPFERFKKLVNATCILRRGWGIDEFTMVAEGYCSTNIEKTRGQKLSEMFATEDAVRECITFTHVNKQETAIMTKPYTITWPRMVVWGEDVYYPGQSVLRRKDGAIPAMLEKVLNVETEELPEDADTYFDELGQGILKEGFLLEWF